MASGWVALKPVRLIGTDFKVLPVSTIISFSFFHLSSAAWERVEYKTRIETWQSERGKGQWVSL